MSEQHPQQQQKNRRVLIALFGIPILVLGLSTVLYYLADSGVIDLGTVNHGELIRPPLEITELPLRRADGSAYEYTEPEPKWTFLVIGGKDCLGDCERTLYIARQSLVALGKKMNRVRLAYLSTEGGISPSLRAEIQREYQGTEVLTVAPHALHGLFGEAELSYDEPRTFYVVDPDGWLMMAYRSADTEQATLNTLGKAVVKDMKRLIK